LRQNANVSLNFLAKIFKKITSIPGSVATHLFSAAFLAGDGEIGQAVEAIFVHPDYNFLLQDNDFAVIKLVDDVKVAAKTIGLTGCLR
jgi:hypothetical protein